MSPIRTDWTPAELASDWHAIEQRLAARKILRDLHRAAGRKSHETRRTNERRGKPQ